jgi:4-amino-4-deoxy-L-arabinose transferase-like glycosyltransferase
VHAGQSEFALRYFSLFFGVLSIPLFYRVSRQLFPSLPGVSLVAAFLATISPYLVWYSQEGKMYTLVVALVLLSMNCYLVALEKGGAFRWLAYVVATTLAVYVHVVAALIIPVQVVAFSFQARCIKEARWRPLLASLLALTVPYLPLLAWQLPLLAESSQQTGFAFLPLHRIAASLWSSYSLGVTQGPAVWAGLPFAGALIASLLVWTEGRSQQSSLGVLLSWLILPVLLFFLITLVRPLYTARYLILVLPAYLLLLALGVVSIAGRTRSLAAVLVLGLAAASAWGLWTQARTPLKADFRSATEYVMGHAGPDDLILFQMPYGRYSFDYYARRAAGRGRFPREVEDKNLGPSLDARFRVLLPVATGGRGIGFRWAEGLYTNAGMTPEEAGRRMVELTRDTSVLWLVSSEPAMWDERGLVHAWLDENGRLAGARDFVRVSVYSFELSESR